MKQGLGGTRLPTHIYNDYRGSSAESFLGRYLEYVSSFYFKGFDVYPYFEERYLTEVLNKDKSRSMTGKIIQHLILMEMQTSFNEYQLREIKSLIGIKEQTHAGELLIAIANIIKLAKRSHVLIHPEIMSLLQSEAVDLFKNYCQRRPFSNLDNVLIAAIDISLDTLIKEEMLHKMVLILDSVNFAHVNHQLVEVIIALINKGKYSFINELYAHSKNYLRKIIIMAVSYFPPIDELRGITVPFYDLLGVISSSILSLALDSLKDISFSYRSLNHSKGYVFVEGEEFNKSLGRKVALKMFSEGLQDRIPLNDIEQRLDSIYSYPLRTPIKDLKCLLEAFVETVKEKRAVPSVVEKSVEPSVMPRVTRDMRLMDLPLAIYAELVNETGDIPESFSDFVAQFKKINERNPAQYQMKYSTFITQYMGQIINLVELLKGDAFVVMQAMIKTSVVALTRYLDSLKHIDRSYVPLFDVVSRNLRIGHSKAWPALCAEFIMLISGLQQVKDELHYEDHRDIISYEFMTRLLAVAKSEPHDVLLKMIIDKLKQCYEIILKFPASSRLKADFFNQNIENIARLWLGRAGLSGAMREIFDACLKYDLMEGQSFSDFAENKEGGGDLTAELSEFNSEIKSKLQASGINIDLAFHYPQGDMFAVNANGGIDWIGMARAIYADMLNLEKLCETERDDKTVMAIQKAIAAIKKQVMRGGGENLQLIANGSLCSSLDVLRRQLDKQLSREAVDAAWREHGKHFIDHYQGFLQEKRNKPDQSKKQANLKQFHVAVWDKNKLDTFLLGDYLSCCLAPDGARFNAIVQRRIDAGMMMHVVYDEAINEPVCGNWLFFAYDQASPGDIYVVANFFEIRAGYGMNASLRDPMVQALVDYTGQYAKAIGAKGFIMRELTYGMIPDFKDKYEKIDMSIEKVGEFFDPSGVGGFSRYAKDVYYLDALKCHQFYIYKTPSLQPAYSPTLFATQQIASTQPVEVMSLAMQ